MTGTDRTLHYRCSFDIRPRVGVPEAWAGVAGLVRGWIAGKDRRFGDLRQRWFVTGGSAQPATRHRIETVADVDPASSGAPEHWCVRYEHACADERFRQWGTDIGLTRTGDHLRLSLVTTHWLLPGYIGDEPMSPVPSAPGVVGQILKARQWECFAGNQRLSSRPIELPEGQGAEFARLLEDPSRQCSVVLLSRRFADGSVSVDPAPLARLLAGVAVVLVAQTPEVNDELDWVVPKAFRCRDGAVRIYQPRVHLHADSDARRHRFFRPEEVQERGADAVRDMIVRGVARRSRVDMAAGVASLEDVGSRQRERRLQALRAKAADSDLREQVALLEDEVDRQAKGKAALESYNKGLAEWADSLEDERDQLASDLDRTRNEVKYWREQAQQVTARESTLKGRLQRLEQLRALPTNLPDMVSIIEELHAGRVVFTENARVAAKSAQINSSLKDLIEAWSCLWAVATDLHDLLFEHVDGVDLEAVFRSKTGYQLSMSESKATQQQAKLMRLRRQEFEGHEIDITPHVKCGSEPRMLRVHFYVDRAEHRLIIGHCGDHLDTFATRRR